MRTPTLSIARMAARTASTATGRRPRERQSSLRLRAKQTMPITAVAMMMEGRSGRKKFAMRPIAETRSRPNMARSKKDLSLVCRPPESAAPKPDSTTIVRAMNPKTRSMSPARGHARSAVADRQAGISAGHLRHGSLMQFRPQSLTQEIDGHQLALDLEIPELPAVAGWRALDLGADLVDRAAAI